VCPVDSQLDSDGLSDQGCAIQITIGFVEVQPRRSSQIYIWERTRVHRFKQRCVRTGQRSPYLPSRGRHCHSTLSLTAIP
jgi:hypothetical protein